MTSHIDLELRSELAALRVEPPATGFTLRLRERLQEAEARRAGARAPSGSVVPFPKASAPRPARRRTALIGCAAAVVMAGAAAAWEGTFWRVVAPVKLPATELTSPSPSPPVRPAPAAAAEPAPAVLEPRPETPIPAAPSLPSAPDAAGEPQRHQRTPPRPVSHRGRVSAAAAAVAELPRVEAPEQRRSVPRLDVNDPLPNRTDVSAPGATRPQSELPSRSERWSPSHELLRDPRQLERGPDRLRRTGRDPGALRERAPAELREHGASERERESEERGESRRDRSRRGHEDR